MDRTERQSPLTRVVAAVLLVATSLTASGCAPILATGVYLWQGGNVVPAECRALEHKRVVVVCRPPSSHEYRQAGASRALSQQVSYLLAENVKGIDVVNPREVDNWVDESDWGDFRELAKAVKADMVVHIELDDFSLYEGKTLYRGRTDVTVTVHDMKENGKEVWAKPLGETLYPRHSGIPAQDKPVQHFEREFISVLAQRISEYFYKHDPNSMFAVDSMANH
mgnify:CR=1 FL=1